MKIKSIYNPVYTENKIIFGTDSNCIEINNIDDDITFIVKLLNNGISISELLDKTKDIYTYNINDLIKTFDDMKILEDDTKELKDTDEEFLTRYKTNINYFKNYSSLNTTSTSIQKKLNNIKILLIGVGGASILASALVGMGIENLILVDFDIIELSNLNRQFIFTEDSLGKLKTDETKKYLERLNTKSKIRTVNLKVEKYEDIMDLVNKSDIVINAIDTPPIESIRWVNYCCVQNNKPLFQMGMGASSILIEKYLYKNGCYDCCLINQLENNYNEIKCMLESIYANDYQVTNTSFAPNVLVGAGMLSMEIFKYIYNNSNIDEYATEIDLNTYEIKHINSHQKNDFCPTCGKTKNDFVNINELISKVEKRL